MPQFTAEIMSVTSVAESIALAIWGFLSSDRAIAFYKQVIVILVVLIAIAAMGIWEGLKQVAFPVAKIAIALSLIHISEPTRPCGTSRMPSSA